LPNHIFVQDEPEVNHLFFAMNYMIVDRIIAVSFLKMKDVFFIVDINVV